MDAFTSTLRDVRPDAGFVDETILDGTHFVVSHELQPLPAGGTRLIQKANGYRWTVKSGEVSFDNGEWTGVTPGGLLRGERDV